MSVPLPLTDCYSDLVDTEEHLEAEVVRPAIEWLMKEIHDGDRRRRTTDLGFEYGKEGGRNSTRLPKFSILVLLFSLIHNLDGCSDPFPPVEIA